MCLLFKPFGGLRGRDLGLCRLTQQFMSALEMPGLDLGLGLFDKCLRGRIVGIESRDLRLKPLKINGDVTQRLGQLVIRNIRILANDLE